MHVFSPILKTSGPDHYLNFKSALCVQYSVCVCTVSVCTSKCSSLSSSFLMDYSLLCMNSITSHSESWMDWSGSCQRSFASAGLVLLFHLLCELKYESDSEGNSWLLSVVDLEIFLGKWECVEIWYFLALIYYIRGKD